MNDGIYKFTSFKQWAVENCARTSSTWKTYMSLQRHCRFVSSRLTPLLSKVQFWWLKSCSRDKSWMRSRMRLGMQICILQQSSCCLQLSVLVQPGKTVIRCSAQFMPYKFFSCPPYALLLQVIQTPQYLKRKRQVGYQNVQNSSKGDSVHGRRHFAFCKLCQSRFDHEESDGSTSASWFLDFCGRTVLEMRGRCPLLHLFGIAWFLPSTAHRTRSKQNANGGFKRDISDYAKSLLWESCKYW